jgi:hypothetical protein
MVDRYGPRDQPMIFRGFQQPSSDFERVRTGVDQRFQQQEIVLTTASGQIDIDIAGNFLIVDSLDSRQIPRLTTIELNPSSDVPNAELTIGRGATIRAPFTSIRVRWLADQTGRGFRLIYGTDATIEAAGLIDVQDILGNVNVVPAQFLSQSGTMRVMHTSDYGYDVSVDFIDQSVTALAAGSVTVAMASAANDAWLHHAEALSVGTGLTQLALVTGATAPTSFAVLNGAQILALSFPTAVNGTTVYSRLLLPRSVRIRSGRGIWWLMGATAETTGMRVLRSRSF